MGVDPDALGAVNAATAGRVAVSGAVGTEAVAAVGAEAVNGAASVDAGVGADANALGAVNAAAAGVAVPVRAVGAEGVNGAAAAGVPAGPVGADVTLGSDAPARRLSPAVASRRWTPTDAEPVAPHVHVPAGRPGCGPRSGGA